MGSTTPHLKVVRPTTNAEKTTHTVMDTIIISVEDIKAWKLPPFQRQLRVNSKVQELSEQIKRDDGVIPGVLTLGILYKEVYLLDGQHRREAFFLSECKTGYVDVRQHHFENMTEMGKEFVRLNSQLVRMRPDDILRGLEGTNEALVKIRKKCPYVGYDMIRRGEKSPIVSMSSLLRCWFGSAHEVPAVGGLTAIDLVDKLTTDDADQLVGFLDCAMNAWGKDLAYGRLWSNLNMAICMWLYRRMVITSYSARVQKLPKDMFIKLLMSLSADTNYLDWLLGRQLRDKDRSPAYSRISAAFKRRYDIETKGKTMFMPAPPWSQGRSAK